MTYISARIDLKMVGTPKPELNILFISDKNVKIAKPEWFNKNGTGYVITSYEGELEFFLHSNVTGKVEISLRGMDVRSPLSKDKHIPCWIDYVDLTIDNVTVFDTIKPVWHDEPFKYSIELKADHDIMVHVSWLPHKINSVCVS